MSRPPLEYLDCDIPEGMTLSGWRAARTPRGGSMRRVLRRAHLARRSRSRRGR